MANRATIDTGTLGNRASTRATDPAPTPYGMVHARPAQRTAFTRPTRSEPMAVPATSIPRSAA